MRNRRIPAMALVALLAIMLFPTLASATARDATRVTWSRVSVSKYDANPF